jgi:hypothetical protein
VNITAHVHKADVEQDQERQKEKDNSQVNGTPMTKRLPGMGSDETAIKNLQKLQT